MADKLVKDSAIKKLAELTKDELINQHSMIGNHESRLSAIEGVENNVLSCTSKATTIPENAKGNFMVSSIKGKTYKNLINYGKGSFVASSANGLFTSTVLQDDYGKSIGLRINTTVDMSSDSNWFYILAHQSDSIMQKLAPNKTYTLLFDVDSTVSRATVSTTDFTINATIQTGGAERRISASAASCLIKNGKGRFCATFTTVSTMPEINGQGIYLNWTRAPFTANNSLEVSNFMIIEGDCTANPPDYFEGSGEYQQSVKSINSPISITTTGKNLFNPKDLLVCSMASNKPYSFIEKGNNNYRTVHTFLPKGTYIFSINNMSDVYLIRMATNNTLHTIAQQTNQYTIVIDDDSNQEVKISFRRTSTTPFTVEPEIQIERGSFKTAYEPYVEYNTIIDTVEPLRSLPNGVCDEIVGNKLIRRVGVVRLNGAYDWERGLINNTIYYFKLDSASLSKLNINTYKSNTNLVIVSGVYEAGYETTGDKRIYIDSTGNIILRDDSYTDADDLWEFLNWNPVTIYYENLSPEVIELTDYLTILPSVPKGSVRLNNSPIRPTVELEYKTGMQGLLDNLSDVVDVLAVQNGQQAYEKDIPKENLLDCSSFADTFFSFRKSATPDVYNESWSYSASGQFNSEEPNIISSGYVDGLTGMCCAMTADLSNEPEGITWNGGYIQKYLGYDVLKRGHTYTISGEWGCDELTFERQNGEVIDGAHIAIADNGFELEDSHNGRDYYIFSYPEGVKCTDKWRKFSKTITIPESGDNYEVSRIYLILYYFNGTGYAYFRNLKIEEGSVATAWTPNILDYSFYSDVNKDAIQTVLSSVDGGNVVKHGNFDNKLEFENNWTKGGDTGIIYHGTKRYFKCMYFTAPSNTQSAYIEGTVTGVKADATYTIHLDALYESFTRNTVDDGLIVEFYINNGSTKPKHTWTVFDTKPNVDSTYSEWNHYSYQFKAYSSYFDRDVLNELKIRVKVVGSTGTAAIKRIWMNAGCDTGEYAFQSCVDDKVTAIGGVAGIVKLTQAEYNALTTKDENTLYIIVG